MVLPSSGWISAWEINVELGRDGNAPFSMDDPAVRNLAGKPSGAIWLSDFYGKSNKQKFDQNFPVTVNSGASGSYVGYWAGNFGSISREPIVGLNVERIVRENAFGEWNFTMIWRNISVADFNTIKSRWPNNSRIRLGSNSGNLPSGSLTRAANGTVMFDMYGGGWANVLQNGQQSILENY